jgi:hypothetical protein
MKAKYKNWIDYEGRVGNTRMRAKGRTKREAIKRLRTMFANAGHPTMASHLEDKLYCHQVQP